MCYTELKKRVEINMFLPQNKQMRFYLNKWPILGMPVMLVKYTVGSADGEAEGKWSCRFKSGLHIY
jgi:hypothetical protein